MKKLLLTAAGVFALMQLYAQSSQSDSTGYKSRKLKIEEINLVSSYYKQDGENASVTGGIGSQKLTDIANVIEVKLIRYDKRNRKQRFGLEVGIDNYTSASSDQIDLKANSSASSGDIRIYPTVSMQLENEKKGTVLGFGLSSSSEYDYQSFGAFVSYSKKTKDRNGEFTAKVQAYMDKLALIKPTELRDPSGGGDEDDDDYSWDNRNSYSVGLSWSQVINKNLQMMFMAEAVQQTGYLSLPFHRVYFNDGTVHQENLPGKRLKIPLGIRANYFAGDKFIIRSFYRFYTDDWGLTAHTAQLETAIKINSSLSISPFYRFYNQSAIRHFAAYKEHNDLDKYYTSNYDLSKFNANFFGAGIRYAPPNGLFNIQRLNMIEIRYGHYSKNIRMNADIISMHIRFK